MLAPQKIPYFILLALILCAACAYLLAGAGKRPGKPPRGDYPLGYFLRTQKTGPMRVIPLGGNSLKSPPANDPGAVFSPFHEEEKRAAPALQNLKSY